MLLQKSVFATIIMIAFASSAQSQAPDVNTLIAESDQFFAKVGTGTVPSDKSWLAERMRLNSIASAIEKSPPSLTQIKVYTRLGTANFFLSEGKGSEPADGWFKRAEDALNSLKDSSGVAEYDERLATIWKERADNFVLLGKENDARSFLEKALKAARASSYKDKLPEATIRERLAGSFFRKEQWKETLEIIGPAIEILTRAKDKPGFNKEMLRVPLWYEAVSLARLKQNALGLFNNFLKEFPDISPHDRANVFREAAVNIQEALPPDPTDPDYWSSQTLALLLKAKNILDQSKDDQDAKLRVTVYVDLAMFYEREGKNDQAEASFKVALEMARKSPTLGKDWPGLIPVLERYATVLKGLNKNAEAEEQLKEASRIKKLSISK